MTRCSFIIILSFVISISVFLIFSFYKYKSVFPQPQTTTLTGTLLTEDKFAFWQKPSFFRGAVMLPYDYGEPEYRIFTTKKDFEDLRKNGANVVSLNYYGVFQFSSPYTVDEVNLKALDNAIEWSEEAGLYAIIHMRSGPGRMHELPNDEAIWGSEELQQKWAEMWQFIAKRYKDKPHVIGYNLMVEPHPDNPDPANPVQTVYDPSVWNDVAKRITNAIREVDQDTPIIVSATDWSQPPAFKYLKPTGDARTVYSFHMYVPQEFTHYDVDDRAGKETAPPPVYPGVISSPWYDGLWDKNYLKEFFEPVIQFQRENNNVPIFIGEFGCNQQLAGCYNYLNDLLSLFEEHGWGYTFFIWRFPGERFFEYEKEAKGEERVAESQYMKMFKRYWSKNQYLPAIPLSPID